MSKRLHKDSTYFRKAFGLTNASCSGRDLSTLLNESVKDPRVGEANDGSSRKSSASMSKEMSVLANVIPAMNQSSSTVSLNSQAKMAFTSPWHWSDRPKTCTRKILIWLFFWLAEMIWNARCLISHNLRSRLTRTGTWKSLAKQTSWDNLRHVGIRSEGRTGNPNMEKQTAASTSQRLQMVWKIRSFRPYHLANPQIEIECKGTVRHHVLAIAVWSCSHKVYEWYACMLQASCKKRKSAASRGYVHKETETVWKATAAAVYTKMLKTILVPPRISVNALFEHLGNFSKKLLAELSQQKHGAGFVSVPQASVPIHGHQQFGGSSTCGRTIDWAWELSISQVASISSYFTEMFKRPYYQLSTMQKTTKAGLNSCSTKSNLSVSQRGFLWGNCRTWSLRQLNGSNWSSNIF